MGLLETFAKGLSELMLDRIRLPDVSSFNDPVAEQTEWTPLASGGSNFRTHRLELTAPGRLEVKKSLGYILLAMLLLAVGVPLTALMWPLGVLFGLPFAGVGVGILWPRRNGFFEDERVCRVRRRAIPFGEVHAVQLLEELVSSNEGASYTSYELNLVLKDGSRVNVTDHADYPSTRADADAVGRMLGCVVWDAVAAPKLSRDAVRAELERRMKRK